MSNSIVPDNGSAQCTFTMPYIISNNNAVNIPTQNCYIPYTPLGGSVPTTQYISEERLREIIREELAALSVHATVETENNDQSAQAK